MRARARARARVRACAYVCARARVRNIPHSRRRRRRQSLVFESLADLTACLRAVLADPELDVVRVKSRYAQSYPAAASAGYRDVGLQVRLAGAAAAAAGPAAAGHVCELQLLLLPFARVKSHSGHRRYIAFRNAMGS
jgi:hypothetical protein